MSQVKIQGKNPLNREAKEVSSPVSIWYEFEKWLEIEGKKIVGDEVKQGVGGPDCAGP